MTVPAGRDALVVMVHGAGPRLPAFRERVDELLRAFGPGARLLEERGARPVGFLAGALAWLERLDLPLDADGATRWTYDHRVAPRIARNVQEALEAAEGTPPVVILIGHSMGAAAAVDAVERLAGTGVRVDELVLLDRMYFEWRLPVVLGLTRGMVEMTPEGARRVGVLHEVLVPLGQLTALERTFVSLPARGHRPIPSRLDPFFQQVIRDRAPRGYGHAGIVGWEEPYRRLLERWSARTGRRPEDGGGGDPHASSRAG